VIGPLPHWLAALGILAEPYNILGDPSLAMWGPIVANVWFGVPFFAITLLAALKSIPGELYESAAIDGAGTWQRFRHVTLPFLAPTIAITVMLRTIWIATFADLIYVMTGGGPAGSTNTVATYIYVSAFQSLDKGYASAVAVLLLVLLVAYALLVVRIRRSLAGRVAT
jgi:multiple sugar transport system permease protein